VLDSAIADLRAQAGMNPSNAQLRYQLLAMYQENNARWRKFWRRDSNDSQFIYFLERAGGLRNDRGTALGGAALRGGAVARRDFGQEQVSRDFHQTVALGAGQSVHVEHKFGSVTLHGGVRPRSEDFRDHPGAGQFS